MGNYSFRLVQGFLFHVQKWLRDRLFLIKLDESRRNDQLNLASLFKLPGVSNYRKGEACN